MNQKLLCPVMGASIVLSPFLGAFVARLAVPGEPLVAALWGGIGLLIGVTCAALICGAMVLRRELGARA